MVITKVLILVSNLLIFFLLSLLLLVFHLRNYCLIQCHKDLLLCFLLTVLYNDHFGVNFFRWHEVEVQLHSLACVYLLVPTQFVEAVLSPCEWLTPLLLDCKCEFIFGLSVLSRCSIFLFLCQQRLELITVG